MSSVLARAVVVLGGDSSELDKIMSDTERRMMKVGERLGDVGKTLSTRVTLPLLAVGALSVKSFGDQEDALAKMNGMLTASGGAAGVTADHMQALSSQLEETTTFADEVTMSAMGVLLAFQKVRNEAGAGNDIFDRTVRVAQDLSELMGRDLQGAMVALAKTMEAPEEGMMLLKRANVILTEEQKNQIKSLGEQGRTLDAQRMVLDLVESKLKGLATTMAQTPLGQFKQAWNQVDNAMEDVGEVLASVLVPGVRVIRDWAKGFQELSPETKRLIVIMAGVLGAIGPLLVTIGLVIKGFALFSTVLAGFAMPVALAVAAIGALIAAGIAIKENWLGLKINVLLLWATIKDAFITGIDWVLGKVQTFISGLALFGLSLQSIPGPVGVFGQALAGLANPLTSAAGGIATLREDLQLLNEKQLAETAEMVEFLEKQALDGLLKKTTQVGTALGTLKPPPATVADWVKPAQEAMKEFGIAISGAAKQEELLGAQFDETSAKADAHEQVIQALIAAGAPLDAVVGANGKTLRQLADDYLRLKVEIDDATDLQDEWTETMNRARSAVEATLGPEEVYKQTVEALNKAVEAGVITWDEYAAAVEHAKGVLDGTKKKADDLSRAMTDLAKEAVGDFVDAVFDAKTSWGDFFRTMLMDVIKLIIKMTLLNALFPKNASGEREFLGGLIPGFARGGFLPAGQVGLVGERGPELIMAGRQGVRITPNPAMATGGAGGGAGGGGFTLQVNVSAIDSQDVARFFEDNEGHIAGAMLRAQQRSSALRGRF